MNCLKLEEMVARAAWSSALAVAQIAVVCRREYVRDRMVMVAARWRVVGATCIAFWWIGMIKFVFR